MSDMENHAGTLTRLCEATEEKMSEILDKLGYREIPTYYRSIEEWFSSELYKKHFIYKGEIYNIENEDLGDDNDIANARVESDGKISYRLRFYNGGTHFSEMLEEALNKTEI